MIGLAGPDGERRDAGEAGNRSSELRPLLIGKPYCRETPDGSTGPDTFGSIAESTLSLSAVAVRPRPSSTRSLRFLMGSKPSATAAFFVKTY